MIVGISKTCKIVSILNKIKIESINKIKLNSDKITTGIIAYLNLLLYFLMRYKPYIIKVNPRKSGNISKPDIWIGSKKMSPIKIHLNPMISSFVFLLL